MVNQKGGVAKSTTAQFVGNYYRMQGEKVLFVDLDAQGNLTYGLNVDNPQTSVYDALLDPAKAKQFIINTEQGDLLASTPQLASIEKEFADDERAIYRLYDAIKPLKREYDRIIIDTPPTISLIVMSALTVSDYAIVPTQADIYSLQGLGQLSSTIATVQQYLNKKLKIAGVLITRFDKRANLTKELAEMLEQTAKALDTKVFDTRIREAIAIKEAQAYRTNVLEYAPKSNVTQDIIEFMNELDI